MADRPSELSRRSLLRLGLVGLGAAALPPVLGGCSSSGSSDAKPTTTVAGNGASETSLLDAARKDGTLNLIAISDEEGSAYRALLDDFRTYSKLDVVLADPGINSGIELARVRELAGRPDQPDVIDVGLTHAVTAADEGLLTATLPDGWGDIPSAIKDPDGLWVSTYYGLIGLVVKPALLRGAPVPETLDDLTKLPEGVRMGFPADPRAGQPLSSAEAFAAVWTVALANGGSFDDIGPGVDFFAGLTKAGIFDGSTAALAVPSTLGNPDNDVAVAFLNNLEWELAASLLQRADPDAELVYRIMPAEAHCPNYYVQGAVADSPHPDAARLWIDYLLSADGARGFLAGGAIPTRFAPLHRAGELSDDDLGHAASAGITAALLDTVTFPSPTQVEAAQQVVDARWGPEILGENG